MTENISATLDVYDASIFWIASPDLESWNRTFTKSLRPLIEVLYKAWNNAISSGRIPIEKFNDSTFIFIIRRYSYNE